MKTKRRRKARMLGSVTPGAAPGTQVIPVDAAETKLRLIECSAQGAKTSSAPDLDQLLRAARSSSVTWIDIAGISAADTILKLGQRLGIHKLSLEDILNLGQRPKTEVYPEYVFIVMRVPARDSLGTVEQLSILLLENCVISVRESESDVFDALLRRIESAPDRFAKLGNDYVAYALIDTAVDCFFPVIDRIADAVHEAEEAILDDPDNRMVGEIRHLRGQTLDLQRVLIPQREALAALTRHESKLVSATTRVFLRDCFDHAAHASDLLSTYRELSNGLMDLYQSSVSNRMNMAMRVLTIIATIFIPLSFLVGLYGMNFDTSSPWNMPELSQPYGYPVLILVMTLIVVGFLLYFRKKRWI